MSDIRDIKLPKWSGSEFINNRRNQYKDKANKPLFKHSYKFYKVRKKLLKYFPYKYNEENRMIPDFNRILSPFTYSADLQFLSGVDKGCWNSRYGPFAAIYYVIRDHLDDFYTFVDGEVISDEKDFQELKTKFNEIWERILNGGGNGVADGKCSIAEMIRIASLFFMLKKSSEKDGVLAVDNKKRFNGNFSGRTEFFLSKKKLKQYRKKMSNTYFSDLVWSKFVMRYAPKTDEDTFWFFNVPNIFNENYVRRMNQIDNFDWFDSKDFSKMMNFVNILSNRGGKVMVLFPSNKNLFEKMKNNFNNNMKLEDDVYYSTDSEVYMFENMTNTFEYSGLTSYKVNNYSQIR